MANITSVHILLAEANLIATTNYKGVSGQRRNKTSSITYS